MQGRRLSEESIRILELFKQGMKPREIAREVLSHNSAVVSVIRRARIRGDLPPKPPKPPKTVRETRALAGVRNGALGKSMQENASPEVWEFVCDQTIKGGYEDIASYCTELLIEEYYRQKKDSK